MSGRSAYVRKKITQTKDGQEIPRARAKSTTSSDDAATISDFHLPARQDPGVGVPTTNARFLKFSEPIRESETLNFRSDSLASSNYGNQSSGSLSGGSADGRREQTATPHFKGPLEDFAYARARRPNIKTEDVSGIEKSGLRSVVDKKSEEVRKGLAKAFAFRKKDKRGGEMDRAIEFRPQSSATVRPSGNNFLREGEASFDSLTSGGGGGGMHSPPDQEPTDGGWDAFLSPPPTGRLPAVPSGISIPTIKRWIGAGRPVQRWNKIRKDPELWDPNGDVLVFFGHKGQQPRPNPSFRLSSHIIEATESRFLITMLREGSTEEDIHMPPSPAGAPPMLHRHMGMGGHGGRHLGPPSTYSGQPTPPVSEEASLNDADGQISYEMYFPTPPNMTKIDQIRHHITTRNVFALLYHASLVGLSLFQALSDLHIRLETYMPPEADNVGTIINYLGARGIDDVRNDAEGAVSLLAWSEGPNVRWEEGWRESFLHCAGMYYRLEACADFKNVTPITRALLERACLETQLRVQAAEERLAEFQYSDMWPPAVATVASSSGPVTTSTAKGAADRLQSFLLAHYTRVHGRWPPTPGDNMPGKAVGGHADEDMWLTRTVAQSLQKDFAALYDFLVNRDIVWDGSEARSSRKWMLVSETGNKSFEADTTDLPMTDMLVEFDNRLRFPHIPHPYPLVPDSIPPSAAPPGREKLSKKPSATNVNSRAGALERRVQLAYTEATNMLVLGSDFTQSDLIDAFSKFEKVDRVGEVDPSTARRGRRAQHPVPRGRFVPPLAAPQGRQDAAVEVGRPPGPRGRRRGGPRALALLARAAHLDRRRRQLWQRLVGRVFGRLRQHVARPPRRVRLPAPADGGLDGALVGRGLPHARGAQRALVVVHGPLRHVQLPAALLVGGLVLGDGDDRLPLVGRGAAHSRLPAQGGQLAAAEHGGQRARRTRPLRGRRVRARRRGLAQRGGQQQRGGRAGDERRRRRAPRRRRPQQQLPARGGVSGHGLGRGAGRLAQLRDGAQRPARRHAGQGGARHGAGTAREPRVQRAAAAVAGRLRHGQRGAGDSRL
jgi:hypothetical protein